MNRTSKHTYGLGLVDTGGTLTQASAGLKWLVRDFADPETWWRLCLANLNLGTPSACPVCGESQYVGDFLVEVAGAEKNVAFAITVTGHAHDHPAGKDRHLIIVRPHAPEPPLASSTDNQLDSGMKELVEQLPFGVLVHHNGQILYSNNAFATLIDKTRDMLIGTALAEALPASSATRRTLSSSGKVLAFTREDGTSAAVQLSSLEGVPIGAEQAGVIVARDVTRQHGMEAQLRLTDRMAGIGTLAAGVAHEINNPMSYVLTNLVFLEEELGKLDLSDKARDRLTELVKEAHKGASRVRRITRGLKTFSRPEEETLEPVDIHRILEDTVHIAETRFRHHCSLVRHYGELPAVSANQARLGQVFLNLIINAAQAIPGDAAGTVTIQTRSLPDAGTVTISVSDDGVGMPDEVRERAFDPFYTTKEVGVGTGLGLYICHSIVTSMHGSIAIESTEGKGTTVTVSLPASEIKLMPSPTTSDHLRPGAVASARVLVVDDEELVARSVSRALRGYDVVVTSSGATAIQLALHERFDVVICDVMMPNVSGMDVYTRLTAADPALTDRFIFVTGGAFEPKAREFLDTVDRPTIDKPFDVNELRAVVAAVCED